MYYADNQDKLNGLILIGSRSSVRLNDNCNVLSIIGSLDSILNSYEESKQNLPIDFAEVIIEGGNHSAFANYGKQDGDSEATISQEEQQQQTIDAILNFVFDNPIQMTENLNSNEPNYFENGTIHAVTVIDTFLYDSIGESKKELIKISRGTNVIIDTDEKGYYRGSIGDLKGYLKNDAIRYFVYDNTSKYVLGCDVSGFNHNREFKTEEDFELFILENNLNFAIIRIGGRGYGKAGNMYYDNHTDFFVRACEYLGVPYGFYFLDEAVNLDEVYEEYDFVNAKLKEFDGKFNILPLAIDMENQHGDGRADNIWEDRVELVNKLIELFKNDDIECMVYANGARIETYLKYLNCQYWTAMYTLDDNIPDSFYDEFVKKEEEKNRNNAENINVSILNHEINLGDTDTIWYSEDYLNKVFMWQFTESSAPNDGIYGHMDLNLMRNFGS